MMWLRGTDRVALFLTGSMLLLALLCQPPPASADDSGDGGDGNDGNDDEMSEEQQMEMDVEGQGGGWPFKNIRGDSAHEVLFQHFDSSDDDRRVTFDECSDVSKGQITRRHFEYYAKKKDHLTYDDFMVFARERFAFLRLKDEDFTNAPPKGHLQPLGKHDPEGKMRMDVDILPNDAHPSVFWKNYVEKHKPVLLRQVDTGKGWKKWDIDYIKKHYGWVDLKIEPKIENRGNGPVLDNMPKRLNVSEYFKTFKTSPLYAVSILPQAMAWDVEFPGPMLCGGRKTKPSIEDPGRMVEHPFPHDSGRDYMTHLYEANLWLGYGRSRSQLHYDKENNVNCLYRGEKKWILVDTREYYNQVEWVRGGRFEGNNDLKNKGTDWVPINPDAVDLRVHKPFKDVKYYEFTQKAGDCIFIPYAMLHWVNKTNPDFQAAVSYMWLPEEAYDEKACKKAPKRNIPMGAMDILWYYNGTGVIPQGYPDPKLVVNQLIGLMRSRGTEYLTQEVIAAFCDSGEAPCKQNPLGVSAHWQYLTSLGGPKTDKKKGLHVSEVGWPSTALGAWLKFAAESDHEGMLPCDEGESYLPRPVAEDKRMAAALQDIEDKWFSDPKNAAAKSDEL